jgi:hypothetical protein
MQGGLLGDVVNDADPSMYNMSAKIRPLRDTFDVGVCDDIF